MEYLLMFGWLFLFMGVPIILTIWNFINLVLKRPKHPLVAFILTLTLGLAFYSILFYIHWDPYGDYYESEEDPAADAEIRIKMSDPSAQPIQGDDAEPANEPCCSKCSR